LQLLSRDNLARPFHQGRQNPEGLFLQTDGHAISAQLHGVAVKFKDSEAEYARHSITSVSVYSKSSAG
jgi:hypothetical protein